MSKIKLSMMMGASALIASFAGAANAATVSTDGAGRIAKAYGAGSSLVAPYWRQAADCFGAPTALIFSGSPPTTINEPGFDYVSKKLNYDCSTTHVKPSDQVVYISTGSGTGIKGVFSHDPSLFGDTDPNTAGNQFFPSVNYGLSDNGLGATDVGVYNNGGTEQGVTFSAPGGSGGTYPNPHDLYGALIQFPVSVDPVAVSYDPVYKKVRAKNGTVVSYSFHINAPRADGSGGLKLDANTYCKIFNGQITNWNDPALTALNGGVSLQDPTDTGSFSVPLQIVGRFDGSGTTSIFSRHLANVCASLSGNQFPDGATTLPATLQGPHYLKANPNTSPAGETLGKFTLADGSDGVAKYLDFTVVPTGKVGNTVIQGRMGYVGPDFVLPAVLVTHANTYGLNSADLKNSSGNFEAPTGVAALTAFGSSSTPPDSDAQGHYTTGSDRAGPQNWVQSASKTNPLANPTAANGYPMVGTTNFMGYTCYASKKTAAVLAADLNWYYHSKVISDPVAGLLSASGLAPLPKAWGVAITETFLNNGSGLGLNITVPGQGGCTAGTVTGG